MKKNFIVKTQGYVLDYQTKSYPVKAETEEVTNL